MSFYSKALTLGVSMTALSVSVSANAAAPLSNDEIIVTASPLQ